MHLISGVEPASPATSSGPHAGETIHPARQSAVVTAPIGTGYTVFNNPIAFTGKMLGYITEYLLSSVNHLVYISLHDDAVICAPRPNSRIADLINRVEEMAHLHSDWNGYNSEPPNKFARDMAETILLSAAKVIVPNRVAPSAQGGVGICFYNGERYGDIECLNTGEILATISDGSGRPLVWDVKPSETGRALERIVEYVNPT